MKVQTRSRTTCESLHLDGAGDGRHGGLEPVKRDTGQQFAEAVGTLL